MLIDCLAPDFEALACMPDNSFQTVRLSQYRGQLVVLFFYPADFTFVCATEVPGFQKLFGEFTARGVALLGVSTDTIHAHKAWKALDPAEGGVGQISYPLISDATHDISKSYDVLDSKGLCVRGVFLIDAEGYVRAEHKQTGPLGRNIDEWLRLVDGWKFHLDSKAMGLGNVCPANWKLGKKGLTPTIEGVAEYNRAGGAEK